MVTADEIASIPLFEALPDRERERLSRVSADMHLLPGEWAVNEGDERALFAVLDGHVEVVKLFDRIPRVIGNRHPGDIFGEVPMTLGSPFPGGYRAVEASRVMRIEAEDYHRTAAVAPDIAVKIGEIARGRIGGLQSIAAEPSPPRAVVVGAQYDKCCSDVRQFLDRNEVTFEWIQQEEPTKTEIRFPDGTTLVQPSLREVADRLGLQTQPSDAKYDTVVIGGGPARPAAALYGASEGLRTIVIEREAPGGQAGTSSRIENYLGFPSGVSGDELASRALQQARRLGAEILVTRSIARIDVPNRRRHVALPDRPARRAFQRPCPLPDGGRPSQRHDLARDDRRPQLGHGRDDAAGVRRAVPVHRCRRRDGLASARDRTRPARLRAHRARRRRRRRLAPRPRSVPPRDERAGHLRLWRRPLRPGQARRVRRRRGQPGDRVRAPVPERERSGDKRRRRRDGFYTGLVELARQRRRNPVPSGSSGSRANSALPVR